MIKLRKIRSFVRRQGRITASQQTAIDALLPTYGLNPAEGILDFQSIFNRSAPVVLEIGFGMGQSLLEMAQTTPEQDFIGIEVHWPGIGALLNGIEQNQLQNIRVFAGDATEWIQHCIPEGSLTRVLIFFPDPWPKQRHHKRRLIQPKFIALLRQKLKAGGTLHLATDWGDYAMQMMTVISQIDGFINVAGPGEFTPRPNYRPMTKFELRGQSLGHSVWDLLFIKEK